MTAYVEEERREKMENAVGQQAEGTKYSSCVPNVLFRYQGQ